MLSMTCSITNTRLALEPAALLLCTALVALASIFPLTHRSFALHQRPPRTVSARSRRASILRSETAPEAARMHSRAYGVALDGLLEKRLKKILACRRAPVAPTLSPLTAQKMTSRPV